MDQEEMRPHVRVVCEELMFFSDFDSGNLARAVKVAPCSVCAKQFELWVCPDAAERGITAYRSWFHFGIRGARKGCRIKLSIVNLSPNKTLFGNHYKPVYQLRPGPPFWTPFNGEVLYEATSEQQAKLTWVFELDGGELEVFFACAYPYPYQQIRDSVAIHEKAATSDTYFYREVLARSLEGRDVELLTISDASNFSSLRESRPIGLFPTDLGRCHLALKPVIVVTARVHPGETPGSYMIDGFLAAVLAQDRRGLLLRKNFVFKVVPVLNPDGVYHGNFRLDVNGVNLNRCYVDPDRASFPVIYSVKTYINYLHTLGALAFYMDFHAQSSKPASFLFGNALAEERQVDNELYAKLVSLESHSFNFLYCDFSERSMHSKDPKDHNSKEGSGRVAVHKSTGLVHCYTVECSYTAGRPTLVPVARKNVSPGSSWAAYFELGVSCAVALLSYYDFFQLPKGGDFPNLEAVRNHIRTSIQLERIKTRLPRKGSTHLDSKADLRKDNLKSALGRTTPRAVHHLKVVSPMLNIEPHLPPLERSKDRTKTRRVLSVEGKMRRRPW